MNQLMVHVERIVRPVNATQRRKLRMRLELLAHLQAAIEEERSRAPDEREAIQRATRRLGDPAALTRTLQQSVPMLERLMFHPVRLWAHGENAERRLLLLPGQDGPMTLGHKSILVALIACAFIPLLASMYSVTTRGVPAIHLALAFVGTFAGFAALFDVFCRLIFAAAADGTRSRSVLILVATFLALEIGLTLLVTFAITDRQATTREVAIGAASTILMLVVSALIAKRVATLRRPYNEWLTLDIGA